MVPGLRGWVNGETGLFVFLILSKLRGKVWSGQAGKSGNGAG